MAFVLPQSETDEYLEINRPYIIYFHEFIPNVIHIHIFITQPQHSVKLTKWCSNQEPVIFHPEIVNFSSLNPRNFPVTVLFILVKPDTFYLFIIFLGF